MRTCSSCGVGSRRVHSRYDRRVADVPVAGSPVVLWLRVCVGSSVTTGPVRSGRLPSRWTV
ncbi:transposase family protein [Actinosynnema sp. NPDC049800]